MAKGRIKKTKVEMANKKIFVAVSLIFLGVMFLARNLGLIPDELAMYWPIILVILGLWGLSSS